MICSPTSTVDGSAGHPHLGMRVEIGRNGAAGTLYNQFFGAYRFQNAEIRPFKDRSCSYNWYYPTRLYAKSRNGHNRSS